MARQIKFRIWSKERKQWVKNGTVIDGDGRVFTLYYQREENGQLFPIISEYPHDDAIIQQFTGLLGKDNKEIYEGDIVKTDPDHFVAKLRARRESEEYTEYTKGQVRWWNEGFAICQEYIGATRISEYSDCDCCPCGLEIIGNIFENPELLQ